MHKYFFKTLLIFSIIVYPQISSAANYGAGVYGNNVYSSSHSDTVTSNTPSASPGSSGSSVPTTLQTKPVVQPVVINSTTTQSITTKPTPGTSYTFTKSLSSGQNNPDIKNLQKFLNSKGFTVSQIGAGSPGKETTLFGPATKLALIKFQKANKIYPAIGFFGPVTRAMVNNSK